MYPTADADSWCVVAVRDDREWSALAAVADHRDWCDDERFSTAAARDRNADVLDELVSGWTSTAAATDVMERLQAAGVPAAAVATPFDLLADPQLHAHDFVQVVVQPDWEPLFVEGSCFRSEHLDPAPPDPAPRHGEHTRDIAAEMLGLDDARLEELLRAGILETVSEPAEPVNRPAV